MSRKDADWGARDVPYTVVLRERQRPKDLALVRRGQILRCAQDDGKERAQDDGKEHQ